MKTSWRDTKKLYRTYINTDPTIDFSDQGISDKGLQRLAALFMPVDERLMEMLRRLGSQDTPPDPEWPQSFLSNFKWLSSVAIVDTSGSVMTQVPSASMRPLDYAGLLEFSDRYEKRKMAAQVKTDEFGTVIMVAMPFFKENNYAGLVVVSFDPRNLVHFSPEPDAMVIISTDGLIWGGSAGQGEALTALKWNEILKDSVQGEFSMAGGEYVWQARYLGQLELVYLTEVHEARAQKPAEPADKAPAEGQKAAPETVPAAGDEPSGNAPQSQDNAPEAAPAEPAGIPMQPAP